MILLRRKLYAENEINETPEQFGSKLEALADKINNSPQQQTVTDDNSEGAQVKIGNQGQQQKK